jgi:hypothetical protein
MSNDMESKTMDRKASLLETKTVKGMEVPIRLHPPFISQSSLVVVMH